MKSMSMKAPALSEIYTQKILREAHKKKLSQIRQERKSHIGFDTNRLSNLDSIKQNKSKSFAVKFNQQNSQINKENLKFLARLQKTRPYFRYTSHENRESLSKSRQNHTFANPYQKRQNQNTEKENMRLTSRVQSVSSSLNQKNLMKDFVKSQRIKSRITRYAEENNRIALKSQKFINMSSSKISDSSHKNDIRKNRTKSTTAQYYNRQDILKNRVENKGKLLGKIPNRVSQTLDENNEENKTSFFSTEPVKARLPVRKSRK